VICDALFVLISLDGKTSSQDFYMSTVDGETIMISSSQQKWRTIVVGFVCINTKKY